MVIIELAFLPIYLLLILAQWRFQDPFGRTHTTFFAAFCPLLHIASTLTQDADPRFAIYGLVSAHFVVIIYLVLFFLASFLYRGHSPNALEVTSVAATVKPIFIGFVICLWFAVKFFLFAKYGIGAFTVLGTVAGTERSLFLDPAYMVASTYASYFALGGTLLYVVQLTTRAAKLASPMTFLVMVFIVFYVITGDTPLGARRFVLLLAILWVSITYGIAAIGADTNGGIGRKRLFWTALVAGTIAVGFSFYYQQIRDNFFSERTVPRLLSEDPAEVVSAIGGAMIPTSEKDLDVEERTQLRPGPFDVIYAVSDRLVKGFESTGGEIVSRSFGMIVPSFLLSHEKVSFSPDSLVANAFDIYPPGDNPEIDLAMSLPATFISEFGFAGAPIAPIIMSLCLWFYSYTFWRLGKMSPAYAMMCLAALYQTLGVAEGDFISVIATLRDFAGMIMMIAIYRGVATTFRGIVATAVRHGGP